MWTQQMVGKWTVGTHDRGHQLRNRILVLWAGVTTGHSRLGSIEKQNPHPLSWYNYRTQQVGFMFSECFWCLHLLFKKKKKKKASRKQAQGCFHQILTLTLTALLLVQELGISVSDFLFVDLHKGHPYPREKNLSLNLHWDSLLLVKSLSFPERLC